MQGRQASSDIASVSIAVPPTHALNGCCRHTHLSGGSSSADAEAVGVECTGGVVVSWRRCLRCRRQPLLVRGQPLMQGGHGCLVDRDGTWGEGAAECCGEIRHR